MSSEWIGRVWEEYPGGGEDFLLALAIADNAGFDDYVYIEVTLRLLHKARLKEDRFERTLARIMAKGWLSLIDAQECLYRFTVGPHTARRTPPPLPWQKRTSG